MKKILVVILSSLAINASASAQTCCPNVNSVKATIDTHLTKLKNEISDIITEDAVKHKMSINVQTNLPFLHRNIFQHNSGTLCSYRVNSNNGPLIYSMPTYPCPPQPTTK